MKKCKNLYHYELVSYTSSFKLYLINSASNSIKSFKLRPSLSKRCTTTNIERNLTKADPTDTICNWASCEEWCLSKGSSPCSKMYGILRDVGATLKFEDCDFSEENGFIDHICSTAEDLEPLNCKRSKFETTVK